METFVAIIIAIGIVIAAGAVFYYYSYNTMKKVGESSSGSVEIIYADAASDGTYVVVNAKISNMRTETVNVKAIALFDPSTARYYYDENGNYKTSINDVLALNTMSIKVKPASIQTASAIIKLQRTPPYDAVLVVVIQYADGTRQALATNVTVTQS